MHKTMLAALIVGASALSIPAFGQVNLGGAAQVGAGVNAGATATGATHAIGQTGAQTAQRLHRADRKAKRMMHRTADHTRSAVDHNGDADAGLHTGGSIDAGNGNTHAPADTGARIDAGAAANQTSKSVGADVGVDAKAAAHKH